MSDSRSGTDRRPTLLRGVRLKRDAARARWVLLAPERTIPLDDVSHAILVRTDGARSFAEIVDELADTFQSPRDRIEQDCRAFFNTLIERRMLEVR